jgi:hypothetical protein
MLGVAKRPEPVLTWYQHIPYFLFRNKRPGLILSNL